MIQREALLARLRAGPIDPLTALDELGIYRLGARVYDLRQNGHAVDMQLVERRNRHGDLCRVALYTLTKEARC